MSVQDLDGRQGYLLFLNDGCFGSVLWDSRQPMPLSFKDDVGNVALGNAALGNAALGTATLGTVALGSTVLGKSLINQPPVQCLLDHLLGRSFSFVSQSLVRSFSEGKAIEYCNH